MSEFKFACPVCGQHIQCDSARSGAVLKCPTCFQQVVVPQAPALADPKFILTGTKPSDRPPTVVAGASRAKPMPPKVPLLAPMGFVIFVLACIGAAVVWANREKASSSAIGGEPVPGSRGGVSSHGPSWTLDLSHAVFPKTPAAGRIHGRRFASRRAFLQGGTLTLRTPARGRTRLGLSVYWCAPQSGRLIGKTLNVTPGSTNGPRVRLRWLNDRRQVRTEDFRGGYALRLELGPRVGKWIRGKIYLCTPDTARSCVAGTFDAEVRRSKSPK